MCSISCMMEEDSILNLACRLKILFGMNVCRFMILVFSLLFSELKLHMTIIHNVSRYLIEAWGLFSGQNVHAKIIDTISRNIGKIV